MASTPEQARMIEKMRSLFLILDPNVSSLSEAEIEEKNELVKRIKYIGICYKKLGEYYRMRQLHGTRLSFLGILSKFMQLLRESVLSHQWPEALDLLQSQCYEISGVNSTIWKVGLAGLYQDCERNGRLVDQFVKHVCVLSQLSVVDVLLDFLLFLLTQTQTADAEHLIQVLRKNTYYGINLKNKKKVMAHALFFAYQGLAFYAEWKLAIFKLSQEENDEYFGSSQAGVNPGDCSRRNDFNESFGLLAAFSTCHILSGRVSLPLGWLNEISRRMTQPELCTETSKDIAKNALQHLGSVKDMPGVWDVFLTRLVEIHEYYGDVEDARNVLVSYRDRNPGNPNAHRYLYEFESRHGGDEVVLLQCLQDIIQLDPCNPLCLTLYHLKEKNDAGAVSLLFDYIDYSHCNQHEQVWQVLADKLRNANSLNLDDALKQCWETRRDWWPSVIFKDLDEDHSATELSQPGTLLGHKRAVKEVLLQLDEPLRKKRTIHFVGFKSFPGNYEQS